MFLSRGYKFVLIIRFIIIFDHNYSFTPVEAVNGVIWSKNESNFVKIFDIQSFNKINKQRLLISRKLETHNFKGTVLKFTAFPIPNLINFISNDTVVTGVHGDMWHLLAEMFNFKIHSMKVNSHELGTQSKNGSWNGLVGYIYRKETDIIPACVVTPIRSTALDYTLATWIATFRFHIKERGLRYHQTWMTELFTQKLWFTVIGFFFALTLASFLIHVLNFENENSRDSISNLRDHFFYIFSIFCNQGWTPQQLEKRSKILLISTSLFAWLIVIAFSSKLISHIAQREFQPPFYDLESFYKNTDYMLVVKRNSFIYSIFETSREPIYKTIVDAGRIIQANYTLDIYNKICNGKYVYLESQDMVVAEDSKLCAMTTFGKPYLTTWVAEGLVRGFKYRRTINLGWVEDNSIGENMLQFLNFEKDDTETPRVRNIKTIEIKLGEEIKTNQKFRCI